MFPWDSGPMARIWRFSSSKQWWVSLAPQVSMSCLNLVKTVHLFTKSSIVRPSCNVEPESHLVGGFNSSEKY